MKETIHPADAFRLAQAAELIKAYRKGIEPPHDVSGKIVPSEESLAEISQNYIVSDEVLPKHNKPEF